MGFSPDFEAYICYLVLIIVASISARKNISKVQVSSYGIWRIGRTWMLLLIYVSISVVLFWLLDRTNAVHDTSIVAAFLVGIAYDQVLNNQVTGITVADNVSAFLKPIQAWAEQTSEQVQVQLRKKDARLREKLFMRVEKDDDKFKALKSLVYKTSNDWDDLDHELGKIRASPPIELDQRMQSPPDTEDIKDIFRYVEIRVLYDELRASNTTTYDYLLKKKKIIRRRTYYWRRFGWKLVVGLVVLMIGAVWFLGGPLYQDELQTVPNSYYRWRLQKPNGTVVDQRRALAYFAPRLDDAETREAALEDLHRVLASPRITPLSVDRILHLVRKKGDFFPPDSSGEVMVAFFLDTFEIENPELRRRLHDSLRFLAERYGHEVPEAIRDGLPDANASLLDVEKYERQWRAFWEKNPPRLSPNEPPGTPGTSGA